MRLAVVAGEASGDLHTADVVRELNKLDASLSTFGIGGDHLAAAGTEIVHHAREMGMVGFFNVIRHLPMFRRIFRDLIERLEAEKPDAILLTDYPGFNLRVARQAKQLGIRVIYYISPQVWAWHRRRIHDIARYVDRMIVIFPFEEDFYRRHGVPVTYVGHPLVEQLIDVARPATPSAVLRLALLPGSRYAEVEDLLPPMLNAVAELRRKRPVEAWIVKASTIDRAQVERLLTASAVEATVREAAGPLAIAEADVALSSSGTAALECAVIGTPVVVMYRLTRATYALAKRLVKLPHFSLVNIVAGKRIVPELLQEEVNGVRIAAEVEQMLVPATAATLHHELREVRARLGEPGAARRTAEAIMNEYRR